MEKDRKARRRVTARGGTAITGPIENPLDFIIEDHMREREVCAIVDRLVAALPVHSDERQLTLDFLSEQLPQHVADEELDLFPLMLKRCNPDEDIGTVIERLRSDHRESLADGPAIAALIHANGQGTAPLPEIACVQMTGFARLARRHLIVENAIIMPLARAHLTRDDLQAMRLRMLERRGLGHTPENETC